MQLVLAPDPVLRTPCAPVTAFDGALAARAWDMLRLMYAEYGRGLAAPQARWTARLFVVDTDWKDGTPAPQVFVNPAITAASSTYTTRTEQCLSIPDTPLQITRPDWIDLSWQDLSGARHDARFTGAEATCIQHENDHLDGILITDRAAS